jgi:hypothetical protein
LSSQQHPLPCKGNILVEHFPSILQAPTFGSIHINIKQGEISQQRKKQSDSQQQGTVLSTCCAISFNRSAPAILSTKSLQQECVICFCMRIENRRDGSRNHTLLKSRMGTLLFYVPDKLGCRLLLLLLLLLTKQQPQHCS